MAKVRAVGILQVGSFHDGETVIRYRQHLIVGEVKRLTCLRVNLFSFREWPGQRWASSVRRFELLNSNLLWFPNFLFHREERRRVSLQKSGSCRRIYVGVLGTPHVVWPRSFFCHCANSGVMR